MSELAALTSGMATTDPEQTEWRASDSTGSTTVVISAGGRLESVLVAHDWRPGKAAVPVMVLEASARALCARFGVEPGAAPAGPAADVTTSTVSAEAVQAAVERQSARVTGFDRGDPRRQEQELERRVEELDAAAEQLASQLEQADAELAFANRARTLRMTFTDAGMLTGVEADESWAQRQSPVSLRTAAGEVIEAMHEQVPAVASPFGDLLSQLSEIHQDLGTDESKGPSRA